MLTRFGPIFPALLFSLLVLASGTYAQSKIRNEVAAHLDKLRPADTETMKYRVVLPPQPIDIPDDLKLDISYKIGHYGFRYVVLYFQRKAGDESILVTRFTYGSNLGIWNDYGPDSYLVERAHIPSNEFDRLLEKALTYYRSTIEEEVICNCGEKCLCGFPGSTISASSADGVIRISLTGNHGRSSVRLVEAGTLHAGDLKKRISNGFENLRVHLFWNVFAASTDGSGIFYKLDAFSAEKLAIELLGEPYELDYQSYFRLAALVEILGEIGTGRSVAVLSGIRENNSLEPDWNKYLSRDAKKALKKINSRKNKK